MKYLLLFLIALLPGCAESITGKVVSVADGDTITILDNSKTQHKIRLYGIDAPEKEQDYYTHSRKILSELVFQKEVSYRFINKDHYGRIVGKVYSGDLYVNKEMVRRGAAWYYSDYAPWSFDLLNAEQKARAEKIGLWAQKNPQSPWSWRSAKRAEARYKSMFSRQSVSGKYWITSSSGKTHNSSCRYYRNSNGYESKSGTGNNCKICGGAR